MTATAVERTTKLATIVDDLSAAWGFLMDHLEEVGGDPEVSIRPLWAYDETQPDAAPARRFEVVVRGMVREPVLPPAPGRVCAPTPGQDTKDCSQHEHVCPECAQGKHDNCDGTSWNHATDSPTDCPCAQGGHQ